MLAMPLREHDRTVRGRRATDKSRRGLAALLSGPGVSEIIERRRSTPPPILASGLRAGARWCFHSASAGCLLCSPDLIQDPEEQVGEPFLTLVQPPAVLQVKVENGTAVLR